MGMRVKTRHYPCWTLTLVSLVTRYSYSMKQRSSTEAASMIVSHRAINSISKESKIILKYQNDTRDQEQCELFFVLRYRVSFED